MLIGGKMKKIGIIVQTLNGGGAERAAANLSMDLNEKYEVYLIVFNAENIMYNYGGNIINLECKSTKNKVLKTFRFIKKVIKISKIKKLMKFDYVISFMENANIINVLTRKREKVIISERNMISYYNRSFIKKIIIKYNAKKADKIVSLSAGVKQDLIDNFGISPNKIKVIYNSCNKDNLITTEKSTIKKMKEVINTSNINIVNIGRLHNQKGQWHLIKAFKLISDKYKNAKLIILGQGDLRKQLEELVAKLDLSDKVIFCGYLKQPHIFMEKADIFAFSSVVEGLGNVLLEALAFGKAIVSTDCYYGPREILAPNTDIKKLCTEYEEAKYGILSPNFKEDKFSDDLNYTVEECEYAKALDYLISNNKIKEKYEEKSLVRAKDFTPEKIKKEWQNFFNNEF